MDRKKAIWLIGSLLAVVIVAAVVLTVMVLNPKMIGKGSDKESTVWRRTAEYLIKDEKEVCVRKWEYDDLGRCVLDEKYNFDDERVSRRIRYEYDETAKITKATDYYNRWKGFPDYCVEEWNAAGEVIKSITYEYNDFENTYLKTEETVSGTTLLGNGKAVESVEVQYSQGEIITICWTEKDESENVAVKKEAHLSDYRTLIKELYGDDWVKVLEDDARGHYRIISKTEYDQLGRELLTYSFGYDGTMTLTREIVYNDDGSKKILEYNEGTGKLSSSTEEDEQGITTAISYDENGDVSWKMCKTYEELPSGGHVVRMQYFTRDGLEDEICKEYDDQEHLLSTVMLDVEGIELYRLLCYYDNRGRRIRQEELVENRTNLYEYDQYDNLVSEVLTNENGLRLQTKYDYISLVLSKEAAKEAKEYYDPTAK